MKHKDLLITKIEKIDSELTNLSSLLNYTTDIREVKDKIFFLKEKLSDIRTLVNNENDDWK